MGGTGGNRGRADGNSVRHSGARQRVRAKRGPMTGSAASPESITTTGSMDSGPVASGRQLPTEGVIPDVQLRIGDDDGCVAPLLSANSAHRR